MSLEATLAEVMGRYREKLRQLLRQDSRATTPPATISDRLVEIKPTKNRDVAESTKASPSNLTERHAQVGEIPPSRFVSMSHEELKSAGRREEDAKLMKENLKMAQCSMSTKSMKFLDFPREIRDQIYSELLIDPGKISFWTEGRGTRGPLVRCTRKGLYPALLRLNKQTHNEANPILYSKNRFSFPSYPWPRYYANEACTWACTTPFLSLIGSQACLIRHMQIPFPVFDNWFENDQFHKVIIKTLAFIRDSFTSISTLTLSVTWHHYRTCVLDGTPISIAIGRLKLLRTHLKAITSLKEIIVNFELFPGAELAREEVKKIYDC